MTTKKILIVKFSALGDIVLSTVIPLSIKNAYPDIEIHYLTNKSNALLLENCPNIDKIYTCKGHFFESLMCIIKEKYDIVFCLNYTLRNYLYSFLSFPKRIVFRSKEGKSWVENYYNTAKKIFGNLILPDKLSFINSDSKILYDIHQKLSTYKRPFIVINPGRYHNNKRQGRIWNLDNWARLAEKLLIKHCGTIFVIGSIAERSYHIQLSKDSVVVFSGLLNLKESCAVLSMADLVISGDSGPAHISSAYNVKTVVLLGSTSPDKIKPYGQNGYYIEPESGCKYCWKKR